MEINTKLSNKYDLDRFRNLNEEWANKPIAPQPREHKDPNALTSQARKRLDQLTKVVDVRGKRVLEIGCGRGHLSRLLADEYDCQAEGIDVVKYDEWEGDPRFHHGDIADPPKGLGIYDVIVSFVVWEHVQHPYTALVNQRELLADDGIAYVYANLHRGPLASHRYRDVYFPWPHLLFSDDVFAEFYASQGIDRSCAWVNRHSWADYQAMFDRIGYGVQATWLSAPKWFPEFFEDHESVLGRYPTFDLKHDFFHAVLTRHPAPAFRFPLCTQ
jgi:SAM-dependent methyltransferase